MRFESLNSAFLLSLAPNVWAGMSTPQPQRRRLFKTHHSTANRRCLLDGGRYGLPGFRGSLIRRLRSSHRSSDASLLLGCQLEDVVHQQLGLILLVALERRWSGPGKNPLIVLPAEQPRGHRCAGTDRLRIKHPTFRPIRFQPFLGQQEVGRSGNLVMLPDRR